MERGQRDFGQWSAICGRVEQDFTRKMGFVNEDEKKKSRRSCVHTKGCLTNNLGELLRTG